jgi:outer membrane protein assembly factor BamB
VRAVDRKGSTLWTRDLPNDVTGLEVVADAGSDGVVVARTVGSPASHYRALSLADGSPLWEFSADEGPISMPTTSDGTAYAATAGGRLHAFDPETGEFRQSYDAYHGLHDRPAVVDGTVAVPSDEGFVYGFETP